MGNPKARWQNVNGIYQIYPRSFKDSNEDGIGDISGIIEKLDYIKGKPDSLGIDAVWISPFYTSPMVDFGYDVSDYYAVDPLFGDLEDFKLLLHEAHSRAIKVMIDFVPNHTSDQHAWFMASRLSPNNEKRDWYVWRNPKPDGLPPNNWRSVFGGSAWQLDEGTGQYYLHSFLKSQPDLNWDNPAVRKAMEDVLHFWLSMGVDGIRADSVRWLSKDFLFRDDLPNPRYPKKDASYDAQLQRYSRYGPRLIAYLRSIAAVVESYPDRIILFEDYLDPELDPDAQYSRYYSVNPAVAAPFNFEGLKLPYSAKEFRLFINRFEKKLDNQLGPFYCFGNHDKSRLGSRVGGPQARLLGLLQLTLPGIPVIYYGDELGMHDVAISVAEIKDPFGLQSPQLPHLGRDPERTPMQWSDEKYDGFSLVRPWLPVADDSSMVNVAVESNNEHSSLAMYRTLLGLRHTSALGTGRYIEWLNGNDNVFGYKRQNEHECLLILLNMSDAATARIDNIEGEVIYSTHPSAELADGGMILAAHQGVIVRSSVT